MTAMIRLIDYILWKLRCNYIYLYNNVVCTCLKSNSEVVVLLLEVGSSYGITLNIEHKKLMQLILFTN